MSLTAISSLEPGIRSRKGKFFENESAKLDRREENFTSLSQNMCNNLESNVFGSGGRNESNRYQLARIGEKKIFQYNTHQLNRREENFHVAEHV